VRRRARLLGAVLLAGALALMPACTTGTPQDPAQSASGSGTPDASPAATPAPSGSASAPDGTLAPDGTDPAGGPVGGEGADGGGSTGGTAGGSTGEPAPVPVTLTISSWAGDVAVVSGYAEVVEQDGTCTATLTRAGAADVVVQAPAVADVATTSCSLEIPGDRLTAGTWTVTLRYGSPSHEGAAAPAGLEVPA